MERVAHFLLWLVPKKDIGELKGADYLAQHPPLHVNARRRGSDVEEDPVGVIGVLT
jgi:hypothetical protein